MSFGRTVGVVILFSAALVGCNTGDRGIDKGSTAGAATGGLPGGLGSGGSGGTGGSGGGGTGNPFSAILTDLAPKSGPTAGGTRVTLVGQGYAAGTQVAFDGVPATDVQIVSANELTCLTPPHAAAIGVDVEVTLTDGTVGRLNNAFTYDPDATGGAVLARVADYGDPTAAEQEILERFNQARQDPAATGQRLGLDFSQYPAKPALTHNQFLEQAAKGHSNDMLARAFYGHKNPDGVNANGRIAATNYDLHSVYGTDPSVNLTESIGAAYGDQFNTPQRVVDAFLRDDGVNPPKHRESILGFGGQLEHTREVGLGLLVNQTANPAANPPFTHFVTAEFARTNVDKPFVTGVAYSDDGDGLAEVGEYRAGVTVTLSHASGFSITTQTKTAGGYAFEVFVPGTYTITIEGQSTQIDVASDTLKVDLKDGALVRF